MGRDIETNNLIEKTDVFADIANVNLFDGQGVLKPEDLELLPTVTSYRDITGKNRRLIRDTLMKVKKLGGCIAFIGFEGQDGICNIMPVRDMGYDYTAYMNQIRELVSENRKNKRDAYAKVLHDDQKLCPIATFVLYFGKEKWESPLSLMDMLDIPEEDRDLWKGLINDYKIRVIHMVNQPEEIRKKYRSDYRMLAGYLAEDEKEWLEEFRNSRQKLLHVEEVLDFLYAYSGDSRYRTVKEEYLNLDDEERKEKSYMCAVLDMVEETGINKGIKIGEERGEKRGIKIGEERGFDKKGMQVYINMRNRGMSREEAQSMAEIDDALVEKAEKQLQ